jgi:phosphatidylserine decarboxylase
VQAVKAVPDLTPAERLNFLVTNRVPRAALTRFMGWFSKVENAVVRELSIRAWQLFVDDLRLHEARKTRFTSLHDCFTRELREGARPVDADPAVIVSPCDAVVGEFGRVDGLEVLQAKGFPYTIGELVAGTADAERYRDGLFVTLRLKSSMYHHFHAPCAGRISEVHYVSGDTWNVNPIALKTIERLFCRNERAVIDIETDPDNEAITLVPVAAILVASMRIRGLPEPLNLRYRGPNRLPCKLDLAKGDEIGYFEHGSTIIMFLKGDFEFEPTVRTGEIIRMGRPLLRRR